MARKIIWQDVAQHHFESIQQYILLEWGESVTKKFTKRVFDFLEILEKYPFIGNVEYPEQGIRGFTISNQTRILYKVTEESIYLLAFYDLRQDSEKGIEGFQP